MNRLTLALSLSVLVTACGGAIKSGSSEESALRPVAYDEESSALEEGVTAGTPEVFYKKDFMPPVEREVTPSSTALMTNHGGTVLTASKTMAIWWGSQWNTASFAGDQITGMDTFFQGFGGSKYASYAAQYSGSNGSGTTASTYLGHTIDTSAVPTKALSIAKAVKEACKITNNNPDPEAVYFIFTSSSAGRVQYCAWHSYGTCGGKPVQVAYMPNNSAVNGCDTDDTWTTHSRELSSLGSMTAHELSEAVTDPRSATWYDSSNQEIGDKCAWSFNAPVTLANNSVWKLQMEWSNSAYSAGTGLANTSGQKGCLQ